MGAVFQRATGVKPQCCEQDEQYTSIVLAPKQGVVTAINAKLNDCPVKFDLISISNKTAGNMGLFHSQWGLRINNAAVGEFMQHLEKLSTNSKRVNRR